MLTTPAGVVIVTRDNWAAQLRALDRLRPGVVRVHLYGNVDVTQHWGPAFTAADLDAVRARLAPEGTLILRTAESAIGADDTRYQLTSPFHDTAQTVADYCNSHAPTVWLELGNEPDRAGLDPYVARFLTLTGVRVARSLLANVPIGIGLPTVEAGPGYLSAYLSDTGDGLGRLPREADALAWHCYGANTLEDSDYLHQRQQLATVLGYGLPVWLTEAGIHEARPWADRAQWYARFVAGLPEQVKGVCFFLLDSSDPQWAMYRLGEAGAAALRGALDALSTPVTPIPVPSAVEQKGPLMPTATEVTTRTIATLRERGLTVIDLRGQLPVNSNPAYRYGSVRGGLAGVQYLIQHWTGDTFGRATLQTITGTDYGVARISERMSQDDEIDLLRWYANYHISRDGGVWGGIAYGLMVLPSGRVYVNWDLGTLTYHAFNANAQSYALCCPNANAQPLTAAQKLALAHVWDVLCQHTPEIPAGQGTLYGHQEAAFLDSRNAGTVCPGQEVLALVRAYRTSGTLPAELTTTPDVAGQQGPTAPPSGMVFAETGKWVIEPFLSYFLGNGGVRMFGLPLSGMLTATAADGQPRQVQYFERWVFEWHPEHDAANQVLGQRLGAQAAKAVGLVGVGID